MKHHLLLIFCLMAIVATSTLDAREREFRIYPLSSTRIAILDKDHASKLSILDSHSFDLISHYKLLRVADFNYLPQKGQFLVHRGPWKSYSRGNQDEEQYIDQNMLIDLQTGEKTGLPKGLARNARINSAESLVLYYVTDYLDKKDLIRVVDIQSGALKFHLTTQNPYGLTSEDVDFARFVPNSDRFLTFGQSADLALWDVYSGKRTKVIRKKTIVFEVAFDQQGKYALVVRGSGGILLYDAKTWQLIRRFKHFSADAKDVQFLPSGKLAMGILWDTIRFWEVPSGKLVRTMRLKERIHHLKYDPFHDRIFIVTKEGYRISTWTTKGKKLNQLTLD